MLAFREIFRFLKSGFSATWSWLMVCAILPLLDLASITGIVWHFFLRENYPILPDLLIQISSGYLVCVCILGIIAFGFGRLRSIQTAAMFYGAIGLFFLLSGLMESSGQEFSAWLWVIIWIITLIFMLVNFSREYREYSEKNTPGIQGDGD